MDSQIPSSMLALTISRYCKPSEYDVTTVPTPAISQPDELLIRVHAASINPIDVKLASGLGRLVMTSKFPYKIGFDLAGVVVAVGSSVSKFSPGDEVYARIDAKHRGSVAEYALAAASKVARKPASLDFVEAASIPLAAQTALQCLRRAEKEVAGGLQGKTVYVPAGLSGTGSFALQLAKNCFGAGKVITTVSTAKVSKIKELVGEGVVDQVVDYTKEDVKKAVGDGKVDFMLDTMGQVISGLPLLKKGGVIVSISAVPSGSALKASMTAMPFFLPYLLDFAYWCVQTWTSWKGVRYSYLNLKSSTEDLEQLAEWVGEGKVKPIVGLQAKFSDIEAVRKGCQQVYDGKGGVGKFVILIN